MTFPVGSRPSFERDHLVPFQILACLVGLVYKTHQTLVLLGVL